ncbi:hypothetical protein F1654_11240 [Alkalicaulis satelles]|uniref:Uncharacterized protein n=1 Tax=Alkalicaulis satelles TaxID=2609175 RepID=A0A5M6ZCD1_9PROT|nr:hypothetical protein [Alkalicaulis satelles]KAA5802389.1 hypothetical protein F1654_11240 [Alkalicaulis satelles]
MTDITVRPAGRVSLSDAIAAAAGSLFAGACLFCAIGAFVWALAYLTELPVLALGAAEAVVLAGCLAITWLLFRKGLKVAANGFENA